MSDPVQTSRLEPFGKYLLDEEIARGGMARVYLARLRGLGGFEKRLVVKQVLPELPATRASCGCSSRRRRRSCR